MTRFSGAAVIAIVFALTGCLNPLFTRYDKTDPEILPREPDDLLYSEGASLNGVVVSQRWHYDAINMPGAWGVLHSPDHGVRFGTSVVAVIDTGYSEHVDLEDNLHLPGRNFADLSSNALDSANANWHGTHVAGTIAAVTNNDTGGAGVGWNRVKVWPLKVSFADASIHPGAVLYAVLYAAGERLWFKQRGVPVQVINLSLGGTYPDAFLREAIEIAVARGITVVAAAGNWKKEGNPTAYPAGFDNTIAVGATVPDGGIAVYSNTGSYLDFAAPGGVAGVPPQDINPQDLIWSTVGETTTTYGGNAGTSMAAPHVAGVVGLMYAYNPSLTQHAVRDILRRTAVHPDGKTWDPEYGYGLIDAGKALLNTPAAIGTLQHAGETTRAAAGTVGGPEYEPPEPGAYLPDDETDVTPGRVMVRLQLPETATGSERDEAVALLAAAYGAHDAKRFHPLFVTMEFDPARDVRDIVSRIVAEPTVRYSQPEMRYTLFPIASAPPNLQSP